MWDDKEFRSFVEKLIDFNNVSVQFKVEFRDRKNKKVYTITEDKNGYLLERKIGNKSSKLNLKSFEELEDQDILSEEDKEMFSKLFERLNNNQIDKISISGLRLRNPILTASIDRSIIANVSKQISSEDKKELYILWKKRKKEEFEEKFYNVITNIVITQLKDKLESDDLPTPIFPTSVALSEIPNYYICEPKETYTLETKIELFNKLADSICGRIQVSGGGQRIYGLYIPPEFLPEVEGELKNHMLDPFSKIINIKSVAGIGDINLNEIGAFEYLFYLLDRVLQAMFRKNIIPDFQVELIIQEKKTRQGKPFYSHYVIPNLNEVFFKLYYGYNKYTSRGISKIKTLISSFLVENWNIDNNLKKNNSELAHTYINRILYFIFCHRKLDMDSLLFLEDLKIKLGDTTPIRYLEEVISWM